MMRFLFNLYPPLLGWYMAWWSNKAFEFYVALYAHQKGLTGDIMDALDERIDFVKEFHMDRLFHSWFDVFQKGFGMTQVKLAVIPHIVELSQEVVTFVQGWKGGSVQA